MRSTDSCQSSLICKPKQHSGYATHTCSKGMKQ